MGLRDDARFAFVVVHAELDAADARSVPNSVRKRRSKALDLVVEDVRQLVALVRELVLDVDGVRERKHQEQGSYDANPCRSAHEECKSGANGYDCNPGPHLTGTG